MPLFARLHSRANPPPVALAGRSAPATLLQKRRGGHRGGRPRTYIRRPCTRPQQFSALCWEQLSEGNRRLVRRRCRMLAMASAGTPPLVRFLEPTPAVSSIAEESFCAGGPLLLDESEDEDEDNEIPLLSGRSVLWHAR